MPPITAIQKIIDWLKTGTLPDTWDMYLTIESVLHWVAELILKGGLSITLSFTTKSDTEVVTALESMVAQHQSGATISAAAIPTWLIPVLLELLKRLF